MPGTKNNIPTQWVGGQRRKIVRRNRLNAYSPRLSTMPVLNVGSGAVSLESSISNMVVSDVKDMQSIDSADQRRAENRNAIEGFEDIMQCQSPSGAVNNNAFYTSFDTSPLTLTPKLKMTKSKKKQGLFSTKKPKTLEPLKSSLPLQVVTSPLPASTPTKAARFFGLETKSIVPESPCRAKGHDDGVTDNLQDGVPVRPALKKQHSLPLLTRLKIDTDNQTHVQEIGVRQDKLKPHKMGKAAAIKGLRMLIPEFSGSRRSPTEQTVAANTRLEAEQGDDDTGYSSESDLQGQRFRIPARPMAPVPKRHCIHRKAPKDFQRMSPITEVSFESLRPAYREGEEVTELGVISEYECDYHSYSTGNLHDNQSHTAAKFLRSRSWTKLPPADTFELDDTDLSPSDELYGEATDNDDEEDDVVHPGTKVDLKRARRQLESIVYIRGPLQTVEDTYLDAAEENMRLEACRKTLARIEAGKQAIDAAIHVLRHKHERLMHEYDTDDTDGHTGGVEEVNDLYSEDPASLYSSIDVKEEPTLHDAKVITFTSIIPGVVKLVDLPSRKKNPVPYVGGSNSVAKNFALAEHKKDAVTMSTAENIFPPLITHYHHDHQHCELTPKKSKLTRDESQLLVQNWISDYNSTEQRPISTRVDPDVLADQETPPAPFPKSDEALSTPPIKPRFDSLKVSNPVQKHYCINNGHIFHPVDLKTIPDDAVVNSLRVRPYLQTYTGIKQHVKIPVLCEKCEIDCKENIWECEIAVCRIVVCQTCAEDMEAEWQERAINGWKHK